MALKSIGKMREVVVFLHNTPTVVSGRGQVDNYSTLLTTRGQLLDKSDYRNLSFGSLVDANAMKLICRFQSAIASTLRSDTKIVISGLTYTMNGLPRLIDQKKHLYEFDIVCQQP
jgi:hypothetical protein